MKKKLICFIAVFILYSSLIIGCAAIQSDRISEDALSVSDNPYAQTRIGVCIYQLNDNFMSLFTNELVDYLISLGFSKENIIVYGSSNNETIQMSQIEELVNKKVDALIVNPVNSSIVHSITDMAVGNEIPLVYINREPSAEEESSWEDYDLNVTYVGCDARQSGIYQGELLMELGEEKLDINKDGSIQYFMIEGAPENIDAEFRTLFSVSTLSNAGFQMDCLLDEVGNWDMATAKLITTKGIAKNGIPEVIICNNDAMALGAIAAVQEVDLVPNQDVFIVGVDALPEALEQVKNGTLIGTVFNDYISQSHSAADAAIKYISGEKNEHYIGCEYVKVNADNVQEILDLTAEESVQEQ